MVGVPSFLHDLWDGQKVLVIGRALREANVTPDEFDACWEKQLRSAKQNDRDKNRLVQLLKKGGFKKGRQYSDARVREKVWFINQVAGRNTPYPEPVTAPNNPRAVCMYACMYACGYACGYVYAYVCIRGYMHVWRDVWINANASAYPYQTKKRARVPSCVHDMWDGPMGFHICLALRKAGIPREEFDACWADKTKSLIKTERGKKELVQLMQKGGLHLRSHGDVDVRMKMRLWFINQVVGRGTPYPVPVTASSSAHMYACTCI